MGRGPHEQRRSNCGSSGFVPDDSEDNFQANAIAPSQQGVRSPRQHAKFMVENLQRLPEDQPLATKEVNPGRCPLQGC